MAVTPTTLTELNDLAKDYYSDVYVPLMNAETPLFNQFAKLTNAIFTGRKWIFSVKTEIGGGSSNAGANKSLPSAAEGTYDQGEATMARQYTRMALDAFAIEVTKKREGSYRPALAEVMEDRLQAHDLETNRQLFGNGDGKVALIAATAASATQTVEKDYGVTGGGAGTRHIRPGDQLALYAIAPTLIGRRVVTSVDHDAGTVTLESTITSTATTNFFTKSTSDDDNWTAGELQGLLLAVSQNNDKGGASFEAIPSTGRWKANRFHNSGTARQLTDELVVTAIAKNRAESRKTPNLAVCREGVVLKYSLLFLPIRRLDGQETQLTGGFKPVNELIAGGSTRIPVMTDLDCPNGRLFLIDKSSFKMADLVGTDWADLDGAQFTRVTDKDAIEGYIRSYRQLICVQRNANTVIEDLEDIEDLDRLAA